MKPPCEIIVTKLIPQIRASIVKTLVSKYGLKQTIVAKRLGITQASVSQYLSYDRGRDKTVLEIFPEIKTEALKIAEAVSNGKTKKQDIVLLVCQLCAKLRKSKKFCEYHRSFAQLEKCRICYG